MTRFDDLGLPGYQRGDGYRPDGLTLRGVVTGFGFAALLLGGYWLLRDAVGERLTQLLEGVAAGITLAWAGLRTLRNPLADDQYATDEERRAARRGAIWTLACAALVPLLAAAGYLLGRSHGG